MGRARKGNEKMLISGPPAILQGIKDHAKATGQKNSEVAIAFFVQGLALPTQADPEPLAKLDRAKQLIGTAILQGKDRNGGYDDNLTEAHALIVGALTQLENKS